MVPDPSLSIRDRAIASWPPAWHGQNLRDILVTLGYDVDTPWRDLPKKDRNWILFTDEQPRVPVYPGFTPAETRAALRRKTEPAYMGTFIGARRHVLHTFATTQSELMKRRVARYMIGSVCPLCKGRRLKREALSVTFAGMDIGTLSRLSLTRMAETLRPAAEGRFDPEDARSKTTRSRSAGRTAAARRVAAGGSAHGGGSDVRRTPALSEEKRVAAQRLAHDLVERIGTLQALGLGYLSMDRPTPTLSPGELQRLRLATQIRSNLFGVVFVLDEPTAGLHPADSEALHRALDDLKRAGNTILVVEHDLDMMRRADWMVDVGPDAGQHGGQVLYSGPPAGLAGVEQSRTARYLFAGHGAETRAPRTPQAWLELRGIRRNNLHDLDARIPLGVFTAVTGVSGSGKSSLISQALVDLVGMHLGHEPETEEPGGDELRPTVAAQTAGRIGAGAEAVRRLVNVDQKPIGRTPRSNLATYTGLFDHVRKLFASTKQAKARRYGAGRFSFNVAKGRCATCEGEGFVSVELLFMPSVYAPCPTCHGARYDAKTLEVSWEGKNIAEVLAMTVEEALTFFAGQPALQRPLALLQAIGLGYLRLGQPATELSGGEAQRIKLATELQRSQRGDSLYVLDEPTTGLHPLDVDKLMLQLHGLVEAGNTVVVVEHELRVVAAADWVIDMGPGAGEEGGRIVAAGPPGDVATSKASRTAPYLRRLFK
jgi:excinuclease ABC subunit A